MNVPVSRPAGDFSARAGIRQVRIDARAQQLNFRRREQLRQVKRTVALKCLDV